MDSNKKLVEHLKIQGHIKTERVERAFRAVDRKRFVSPGYEAQAYQDKALPIGDEATISAPHMVAINTELLDVENGNTVLEIGSGSGYQLAILAELTDKEVVGVERVEALVESSREALEPWDNARVIHGNGIEAVEGKFDRVLFSCSIDSLELVREVLETDGIAVAPVDAGLGQVLKKYIASEDRTEDHTRVRFVDYRDEPV